MKGNRAFIDSNIWLYAHDRSPLAVDKRQRSIALIVGVLPVISIQVVNEVCNNLFRKMKFTKLEVDDAVDFMRQVSVLQPITWSTYPEASMLHTRYSLSFYDSLVVAAALQAGVDTLYSEDMQHGLVVDNQLEIVNPLR